MGFFGLFSDSGSSSISSMKENRERNREARENIARAKQLVAEADEIYSNAYAKAMDCAYKTEEKLRKHTEFKKRIARDIGENISVTLTDFKAFNIDSRVVSAPNIKNISTNISSISGISSFSSSLKSGIVRNPIDLPSILSTWLSEEDYYESRQQKNEAKLYKQEMRAKREELRTYCDRMREIRSFISIEEDEISELVNKIKMITNSLNLNMNRNSFSDKEADYLKNIHKIAQQLCNLLSTEFLSSDNDFRISDKYKNIFDKIKGINNCLPTSPSINDILKSDILKYIEDIEDIIVY